MLMIVITGGIAGLLHVLSGPDHLAAVAPFAVERHGKSWLSGFYWGVGHTLGVWGVGLLAFLFREVIPIDFLSTWSERFVGLVLIVIGLWGLRKAWITRFHYHAHIHDGVKHTHFHFHRKDDAHPPTHETGHSHSHAPLGIGVLHGLAGSSHLLGVLPALMLPTRMASLAYVVSFGFGSIISMTFFSWALGKVAAQLTEKHRYAYNWLMMGFSLLAIGVGGIWLTISVG